MSEPAPVRLDLNSPVFQRQLFALPKDGQTAVLNALRKLAAMSWPQVYADAGLRWEAILSRIGPHGGRLYSLRIGRSFRAVAYREGDWLRLLTLHPDHDTAYR
jgi:hypothetical protein